MITRCPRCHGRLSEGLPRSCRLCSWHPLELLAYLERGLEAWERAHGADHPVLRVTTDAQFVWAVYNQGVGAAATLRDLGLIDRSIEDSWLEYLAEAAASAVEGFQRATHPIDQYRRGEDVGDVLPLKRNPR